MVTGYRVRDDRPDILDLYKSVSTGITGACGNAPLLSRRPTMRCATSWPDNARLRDELARVERERAHLERERDRLRRENERLKENLEAARRAGARPAAPFSKGAAFRRQPPRRAPTSPEPSCAMAGRPIAASRRPRIRRVWPIYCGAVAC